MKRDAVKQVIRARLAEKAPHEVRARARRRVLFARSLVALSSGIVLALGLGLAGFVSPSSVARALDPLARGGPWDARPLAAALVVVAVGLVALRAVLRSEAPLFGRVFLVPTRRRLDRELVAGALLAGVGLGATGLDPTTAAVAVATLDRAALLHAIALVAGLVAAELAWTLRRGLLLPPR